MAMVWRRVRQLSSISGFGASRSKALSRDSLKNVSHSLASKGGMQKGHHLSLLQHEIELRRIKEELSYQKLTNKLDRDFQSISAKMEANMEACKWEIEAYKRHLLIYHIGTLVAIYVVGLAVLHATLSKGKVSTKNCDN